MKQEIYTMISQEVINKNGLNGVYYLGKLMELINAFRPNSIEEWESDYCSWARQTGQDVRITEAIDRAFKYPIVDMLNKPFNEKEAKLIVQKTINHGK